MRTLKGLRADKNWSQKELADKLKVHFNTYASYERGDTEIPLSVALKLADLYGITDLREIKIN